MILADSIKCTIPSVNALKIKGQELTCSTSLIDSAKGVELFWIALGAIGAFGAMIITLVMARYAWKAWNTAQQQLEATKDIALAEKRQAAMPDLLDKLRSLREAFAAGKNQNEINGIAQDAYLAADIWAATYTDIFRSRCMRTSVAGLVEIIERDAYFRNPAFMLTTDQRAAQRMEEKRLDILYRIMHEDILSLHGQSMTQSKFIERQTGRLKGESK